LPSVGHRSRTILAVEADFSFSKTGVLQDRRSGQRCPGLLLALRMEMLPGAICLQAHHQRARL